MERNADFWGNYRNHDEVAIVHTLGPCKNQGANEAKLYASINQKKGFIPS